MTSAHYTVNDQQTSVLSPAWRACVGTGRIREVLHADYQESLALAQEHIGFDYVRAHGLFHDDLGVVQEYHYGGKSSLRYNFNYIDQAFDAWLAVGIRPFVELGFMPQLLASGSDTVFWWKGNITPPADLRQWAELVKALLRHLIARYGLGEVQTWPIEVWNEPNLVNFWSGTQQDYFDLYAATALAVKEVDASLEVGGPAISPGSDDWLPAFAEFVAQRDLPCDFVSKHAYTTGPAQHRPFGVHQTLRPAEHLLEQFATPRELLAGTRLEGLPVHITEFSSSYRPDNPIHDTAFQAAYLAPVLVGGGDYVDSFSYWTVSDVFEEAGVPVDILHGGFGMLGFRQLPKPTFHLYSFMAELGPTVLHRSEDAIITRTVSGGYAILAWQPTNPNQLHTESHRITFDLPALGASATVLERHVDEERGNLRRAWRLLGSPAFPDLRQTETMRELAQPVTSLNRVSTAQETWQVSVEVGPQGIALVQVDPVAEQRPVWDLDERLLGLGEDPDAASSGPRY